MTSSVVTVVGLVALVCGLCVSLTSAQLNDWEQYHLIWADEFNNLDLGNWQYEVTASGGGNGEFQLYTQDTTNSYVAGGILNIKATLLEENINPQTGQPYGPGFMQNGVLDVTANYGVCTNPDNGGCYRTGANGDIPPVMSARLRSYQRFSFRFGRTAIRAKMPVGDWLWPAIWMLPEDWVYGGWPRSGEIDIIETIGNRDLQCGGGYNGIQHMGNTLHWGPAWDDNHWWKTTMGKNDNGNNYGDNFHIFYLDWSPNGLRFYVDDQDNALLDVPYPLIDQNPGWINMWEWGKPWNSNDNPWAGGLSIAPFDQAFHFLLNVAVGGNNGFIPDGCVNRGGDPNYVKPWNNGDWYNLAMQKFYNARGNWKWTWDQEGANNAMQIDYIRVYQHN